jgi:hypothetical protein
VDSASKYVYDFEVYYGWNDAQMVVEPPRVVGGVGTHVVLKLVEGLQEEGHVLTTDNYFSSMALFTKLATMDIYASGTMRYNRIGLPKELKRLSNWTNTPQGTIGWHMQESRGICYVVWKDKRPVLLISTSAIPIQVPCIHPMHIATVPRRNGAMREPIQTSLVHLEYTTNMKGVDVVDQMRAGYSCQSRSHKWWHRLLHFMWDQSEVNMYIIYLWFCKRPEFAKNPMSHLQFKPQLCEALLHRWPGRERFVAVDNQAMVSTHLLRYTRFFRPCVLCGECCYFICPHCRRKFICLNEGCFAAWHQGERVQNPRRQRPYNVLDNKSFLQNLNVIIISISPKLLGS